MVIIQQMLTFIIIIIIPTLLSNCKKNFQGIYPLFFLLDPVNKFSNVHAFCWWMFGFSLNLF